MAAEIQFFGTAGATHYFTVQNPAGQFRRVTTGEFEDFDSGNWEDYAHTSSEIGAGFFSGDEPAGLDAATIYYWFAFEQLGSNAAESDPKRAFGDAGLTLLDRVTAAKSRVEAGIPNQAAGTSGGLATHLVTSGTATIASQVNGKVDVIDSTVDAIKERTDRLPDAPAAVGSTMQLDLTQALDETATAATLGAALNAARAQGFGRWVISDDGLSLTIYRSDGTTPLFVFTLDAARNTKSREPQ